MDNRKAKILVTRALPANIEKRLLEGYAATLNEDDRQLSPEDIVAASAGHDGVFCCSTERLDAPAIDALADSVKIIVTLSVGYEHIDLEAAQRQGIVVTNTPDVLIDATADVALLCLLGAARRAWEGIDLVRSGRWNRWTTTMLLGVQVTGKRLGIYGMGSIGQAVAQRARGFGMPIHYHNRNRLESGREQGATYHPRAEDLLAVSDFLSINCPSTDETRGFLNHERIARLPDGAVVVNTARGDIVDDEALIGALRSGKLAAAGLDVYAGEPNLHPGYRELDNVFLLPHLGSASLETRDAMGFCCLDNLDAFFAGRPCPTALT